MYVFYSFSHKKQLLFYSTKSNLLKILQAQTHNMKFNSNSIFAFFLLTSTALFGIEGHDINSTFASTMDEESANENPLDTTTNSLRGGRAVTNKRNLLWGSSPTTTFHIKGVVYTKDGYKFSRKKHSGAKVTCYDASSHHQVCQVPSTTSTGLFDCTFQKQGRLVIGSYYCKVEDGLSFEACHGDHPSKPEFLIKVGTNVEGLQYRYLSDDDGVPKLADDQCDETEKWYWDKQRLINSRTGRALTTPVCDDGASVKLYNKVHTGPKQKWRLTNDDRLESIGCPGLYLHKGGSKNVLDKLLIRNNSSNKEFRQNWLPTCINGIQKLYIENVRSCRQWRSRIFQSQGCICI